MEMGDYMKKIIILCLSLFLLMGCSTSQKTTEKKKTVTGLKLSDIYNKRYMQNKILYVNKDQYSDKSAAYDAELVYVIKKTSIIFETNLKYSSVTYKKVSISDTDRDIIAGVKKKYSVFTKGAALGMTIFLSDKSVYIANNTLDQKGYTYVASLKEITETSKNNKKSS